MDGLRLTNIILTSKIVEAMDHLLRGGNMDASFSEELIRIRNQWRNKLSGGADERTPLVIPFTLLQSIQKELVRSPLEEGKTVYLHELIEGSDLFFCGPPKPERSPELETRLARLRQEAEEREYQRMVKNVATELRCSNQEQLRIDMQSTKRQLAVVFNFIVTIAAAFVFGYYCGKWLFSGDFLTVYCLQEVEETAFHEWFEPELRKQDYHGVFKKRTGQQSDGCAVFFKEATFELVKVELIEYQRNSGILNRDNIGMVLLLKPKLVGATKQLCVATTHLLFNPKAGEIKLAQLCLLLAEIYRLTSNGCPILLCGDFNMRPLCPLYAFIEQGALDYSRVSAPEIAGYFRGRSNRRIPSPLFPPSVGISTNCTYEVVRDLASQDNHQKQHCSSTVLKRSRVCDSDNPKTDRLMKDDMPKRSKWCEDQLPERDRLFAPEAYYRPPLSNPWTMPLPQMTGSYKPPLLRTPWPPNVAPYLTQLPPMTMPLVPMSMYCAPPACNHLLPHPSSRQHVVGTTSGPEGETYQHFQQSEAHKGNSRVTHSFNFKSAYPHQACQDNGPSSVTTFHLKAFETVDYIFHTMAAGSTDACQLRLLARLALPSNRTLKEVGPLPNADISSDHIILCAKFEFIC